MENSSKTSSPFTDFLAACAVIAGLIWGGWYLFGGAVMEWIHSQPLGSSIGEPGAGKTQTVSYKPHKLQLPPLFDPPEPAKRLDPRITPPPTGATGQGAPPAIPLPGTSPTGGSGPAGGSSPPLGPAPSAAWSALDAEIGSMMPGRFVFNPPRQMKIGASERIEVRLSRDFAADLSANLQGHGVPREEQMNVGAFMTVDLKGPSFKVSALNTTAQPVPQTGFTQWIFEVTPIATGRQKLDLVVSVRLQLPGREERLDRPVKSEVIEIQIDPIYQAREFVTANWQWLWTAILVPVFGWWWAKRGKKRPAKQGR